MKLALEYGPLILFFVVNSFYGIYYGTAVLVLATVVSLAYSWVKTRTHPQDFGFWMRGGGVFWRVDPDLSG